MLTESPDISEDLVALVGSRLCHDLISPLGAIGNGVELLAMTSGSTSPELQLISESVAAANARVKFFRLAFGRTSEQRVGRPEMTTLMREVSASGRVRIEWQAEGDHSREAAKLVCLAILCLEPAMPRGGDITVDCNLSETPAIWTIRGVTRLTKLDPELWSNLDGKTTEVTPAQVQFALLPRAAALQGRTLQWEISETEVLIRL